jgi:hypothetical protein
MLRNVVKSENLSSSNKYCKKRCYSPLQPPCLRTSIARRNVRWAVFESLHLKPSCSVATCGRGCLVHKAHTQHGKYKYRHAWSKIWKMCSKCDNTSTVVSSNRTIPASCITFIRIRLLLWMFERNKKIRNFVLSLICRRHDGNYSINAKFSKLATCSVFVSNYCLHSGHW